MTFSLGTSARLTALIIASSVGTGTALAQQPQHSSDDTPTFIQEKREVLQPAVPAAPQAGTMTLKPLAPPPAVVVEMADEATQGPAQVVPPAPKLVTRTSGAIFIAPKGALSTTYASRNASSASPLRINSGFGYRRDPFTRRGRMHTGIDLKASYGDTVGTSLPGTISFAGVKRGYGNVVVVDHGGGISTYYAHLAAITVSLGQPVDANQVIGLIGSTGRSTGPHLHYEVRANGRPLNPFATLTFENGIVFVDGRPLDTPADEGWGDGDDSTSVSTGAPSATGVSTRPRRAAASTEIEKHVLVYGEDSLTEY